MPSVRFWSNLRPSKANTCSHSKITTLWLHVTTVKVLDSLLCQLLLLLLLLLLCLSAAGIGNTACRQQNDNEATRVLPLFPDLFLFLSSFFLAFSFGFTPDISFLVFSCVSVFCHFSIPSRKWNSSKLLLVSAGGIPLPAFRGLRIWTPEDVRLILLMYRNGSIY